MASGADHYQLAERLLAQAYGDDPAPERTIAIAQVHATLALAAATALNDAEVGMANREHVAWCDVAATKPEAKS